jgi:3'-phosphoadenosine 5'-phosphosulfate sulfotransferase
VVLIAKKEKNVDKIEPKTNDIKKEPKLFIDFSEGKINVKNNNKFKLVNNKTANSFLIQKSGTNLENLMKKKYIKIIIYKNCL